MPTLQTLVEILRSQSVGIVVESNPKKQQLLVLAVVALFLDRSLRINRDDVRLQHSGFTKQQGLTAPAFRQIVIGTINYQLSTINCLDSLLGALNRRETRRARIR